jgi:hypothetical protein
MKPFLRLRQRIADSDCETSVASQARAQRWATLIGRFPNWSELRVLDLGGTVTAWQAAGERPGHLTLVNLLDQIGVVENEVPEPWITVVKGDACDPPAAVTHADFDLIYSNSVIEHVGGHARRAQFAEVVRRLAPHYWVQTPNRYFPVEPQFLFPGFQFLPVKARTAISQHWKLGWYSQPGASKDDRVEGVLEIELLSTTEMKHYFPDATILKERFGGLTKSLTATR